MVGQNVYTEQEIRFILDLLIKEAKGPEISEAYDKEFGKPLTPNQLRYVKNKYGKDPKYGTAAINSSMNKNNKHSNKRKQTDDGYVDTPSPPLQPPSDSPPPALAATKPIPFPPSKSTELQTKPVPSPASKRVKLPSTRPTPSRASVRMARNEALHLSRR